MACMWLSTLSRARTRAAAARALSATLDSPRGEPQHTTHTTQPWVRVGRGKRRPPFRSAEVHSGREA